MPQSMGFQMNANGARGQQAKASPFTLNPFERLVENTVLPNSMVPFRTYGFLVQGIPFDGTTPSNLTGYTESCLTKPPVR